MVTPFGFRPESLKMESPHNTLSFTLGAKELSFFFFLLNKLISKLSS